MKKGYPLRNLVALEKPTDKNYDDLAQVMKERFMPKSAVIAEHQLVPPKEAAQKSRTVSFEINEANQNL